MRIGLSLDSSVFVELEAADAAGKTLNLTLNLSASHGNRFDHLIIKGIIQRSLPTLVLLWFLFCISIFYAQLSSKYTPLPKVITEGFNTLHLLLLSLLSLAHFCQCRFVSCHGSWKIIFSKYEIGIVDFRQQKL